MKWSSFRFQMKSGSPKREEESFMAQEAPKKGASVWQVFFFLLLLPWKFVFYLTRGMKSVVFFPLRLLLSFIFVGLFFGGALVFIYGTMSSRYDLSEVNRMPERTIVLDRKGKEIGRLHGENRQYVKLSEVPYYLVDAIVVREDKRFFEHGGVDWIGVGRSLAQVAKHKRTTQGASTITMQLARNSFDLREKSFNRKFLEVALAKRIEASNTKEQILEAYLNRIFWGHTYFGISSAARCYFGKQPTDLTLAESALLAGIIYGPNEFSPFKNPEKALKVRNIVLDSLLTEGKITHQDYELALKEPLKLSHPASRSEQNYAMDIVRRELERILEEEDIQLGGLRVQTTLDLDLQNAALDALNKKLSEIEKYKQYSHPTKAAYEAMTPEARAQKKPQYIQGSVVVIDHVTGATLVLVGGRDAEASKFNRALQAKRQIGSLFKPFVYATAFERGISPESSVSDNPLIPGEVAKAGRWSPRNSDGRFLGPQPAWFGLVKSRNTMSVRMGQYAGMDNVLKKARLSGFSGVIQPTPASYLGTFEATPYEIAAAYTVFANGGVRPTPYIIETISDTKDTVLHFSKYTATQVFSPATAVKTLRILEQVTKSGGTAGSLSGALGFKKPSAGKTGTTDNYTNAWFAGFTSSLTACVWVGMDTPKKTIEKGYGGTLALPIWAEVMKAAEKAGYPFGALRTKPGNKDRGVLLCRESRLLAHSGCRHARTAYAENMIVSVPTQFCPLHPLQVEVVEEGKEEEEGKGAGQPAERGVEILYEGDGYPEEPSTTEAGQVISAVIVDEEPEAQESRDDSSDTRKAPTSIKPVPSAPVPDFAVGAEIIDE